MSRPQKKDVESCTWKDFLYGKALGYNQACGDWEKFLPNEEELYDLILDGSIKLLEHHGVEISIPNDITTATAKTILKRLGK